MFDLFEEDAEGLTFIGGTGPYIPDAAECLRCGLCVGHCPTFKLTWSHEETPRARLRTIAKILVAEEAVDSEEREHLNNCLQCRACEAVCPSRVAYGELFDEAQARLPGNERFGLLARAAFKLIESKALRRTVLPFIALYLASGLQRWVRRSGILARLNLKEAETLSSRPASTGLKRFYPALSESRGRVGLFAGCLTEHFDRQTLDAAIRLIRAIGFDVVVPRDQTCCGAIHQHNGRQEQVPDMVARNIEAFDAAEVDAVVFGATGCGAMLSEYRKIGEDALTLHERLFDLDDFLLEHWPEPLSLKALDLKVAVHEPCSQRNVLKNQAAVYALLQKIPGLTIEPLADNHLCCGSGGAYMLTHPGNAKRLRDMKLQAIAAAEADIVVSANFGCALFLNAANSKQAVKVVHPLHLLSDAL